MHRTTTAAALLVTVAVSVLAGCVTVQHPSVPGVPLAPSRPSAAGPDGPADPRIVQAPAREALELVGPRHTPAPAVSPASAVSAASTARKPSTPGTAPAATPRPSRPAPSGHTGPRLPDPLVAFPRDLPRPPPGTRDMCALGGKYGGWAKDSNRAVICQEMYGR